MVVETCQRAGVLDVREFYQLPAWVQSLQLGHTANLVTGAYQGKGSAPPTSSTDLARIIAQDKARWAARQGDRGAA